jgi:anti-anti-sigma factor
VPDKQAHRFARVAERQDEEPRAAVLGRLRMTDHRSLAVVHLRFFTRCRRDDDARLDGRAAAPLADEATDAGVAGDTITIIDLHGRLGVESGGALYNAVHDLVNAGGREVVLSLLGVTDVDAAGLGALASTFSLVRDNGGQLKLVVRCATVRELLIRTKLLDLLPTFPTEAEAIARPASAPVSMTSLPAPRGPMISYGPRRLPELMDRWSTSSS